MCHEEDGASGVVEMLVDDPGVRAVDSGAGGSVIERGRQRGERGREAVRCAGAVAPEKEFQNASRAHRAGPGFRAGAWKRLGGFPLTGSYLVGGCGKQRQEEWGYEECGKKRCEVDVRERRHVGQKFGKR